MKVYNHEMNISLEEYVEADVSPALAVEERSIMLLFMSAELNKNHALLNEKDV